MVWMEKKTNMLKLDTDLDLKKSWIYCWSLVKPPGIPVYGWLVNAPPEMTSRKLYRRVALCVGYNNAPINGTIQMFHKAEKKWLDSKKLFETKIENKIPRLIRTASNHLM